jgi:preprotein translocase subunit SecA
MRQGIGLRGFAQEDPLNAFKKEAFGLFEEMSTLIRHQVASTIFRVQLVRQPAPPPQGVESRGEEEAPVGAAAGAGARSGAAAGAGAASGTAAGSAAGPLARALPQGRTSGGSTSAASGGPGKGGELRPGYSPAGVRMGRNDPCWCGSGVKYKKCHGR